MTFRSKPTKTVYYTGKPEPAKIPMPDPLPAKEAPREPERVLEPAKR